MENSLYYCQDCAKMSWDKHGDNPIDRGWDVSCVMNSINIGFDGEIPGRGNRAEVLNELYEAGRLEIYEIEPKPAQI